MGGPDVAGFQGFQDNLDRLESIMQPSPVHSTLLVCVETCEPVACHVCGLYFPDMRLLRSHQARKHSYIKAPKPNSEMYVRNAVDGMPQCAHCLRTFTRVEGLKNT